MARHGAGWRQWRLGAWRRVQTQRRLRWEGAMAAEDTKPQEEPELTAQVGRDDQEGPAAVLIQAGKAVAYLRELARELHALGFVAKVTRSRSGVAFALVVNPSVGALKEMVTCAPSPVGLHDWYYWWSWGECMHRVGDPAGAAAKVAHVLDGVAAPTG